VARWSEALLQIVLGRNYINDFNLFGRTCKAATFSSRATRLQLRQGPISLTGLAGAVMDVLVVDDDGLMRELVSEWLTQAGYSVREACNGEAAIATLLEQPVSLVITDMHMPRCDGAQTLDWLRRERASIPVIAMSGHFASGRKYSREAAQALGAGRVLTKPFTQEQLLDAVRGLIGSPPAA